MSDYSVGLAPTKLRIFYMDACLYVDKLAYVPQDHFNYVV